MGLCRKQNRILDFLNHFNFINLIVSLFITSTLAFRRNCCYLMSQSRQKFSSNSNESMREVRVKGIRSSSFLRSVASSAATEGSETPTILYEGMHGISTSLTLLEHVNLNIPEHKFAIPFYLDILGFGLDPRRAQNVVKGSGTVWVNCGPSQFHLPSADTPQIIPGSFGLSYSSLEPLKARLLSSSSSNSEKPFSSYEFGVDRRTGREYIKIVDVYGNNFYARQRLSDDEAAIAVDNLIARTKVKLQPVISKDNANHIEIFGKNLVNQYGTPSECLGIDYVEFNVKRSNDDVILKIAQFYEYAMDAAVSVVQDGTNRVAIIGIGSVSSDGRPSQCLLFREVDEETPPYDGHHVALYVGKSTQDFYETFKQIEQAGIVWVNPRFTDKATNLSGAKKWNQFRFKDILDLKTGKIIYTLEHEIRSVEHEAWPGQEVISYT